MQLQYLRKHIGMLVLLQKDASLLHYMQFYDAELDVQFLISVARKGSIRSIQNFQSVRPVAWSNGQRH